MQSRLLPTFICEILLCFKLCIYLALARIMVCPIEIDKTNANVKSILYCSLKYLFMDAELLIYNMQASTLTPKKLI